MIVTPLGHEEMIIVVNREHPLARQKTVEAADLTSLRFILYEKHTAMQNVIDRYFESLGVTPRIAMEVENNEAIKSLVRAGLGASIMPLCAVAQEPADSPLRVLRVKGKPLTRELRLVSADAEILPKAIRELAASLVTALGGRRGRLAAPRSIASID
jgi:DNA-binding transcriptional LysR family regulator